MYFVVVNIVRGRVITLSSIGCKVIFIVDGFENTFKAREGDQKRVATIAEIRRCLFEEL